MQFAVNKTQENGCLVRGKCIMTMYWLTWPNLCGKCWPNTTFNRCINHCISETWAPYDFSLFPSIKNTLKG